MRWIFIIIGFFAVVFAVNATFIYLAVSTAETPLPSYAHTQDR
jgi:nitrogen fixation protein FixH